MQPSNQKGIIFLGASGNVGKYALEAVLKSQLFQKITLVSRRPLPQLEALDKRVQVQVIDLDKINQLKIEQGTTSAVMALGAGKASQLSKEELERVDAIIPIRFAETCKKQGVQHYTVLSAVGADIKETWSMITRTGAGGGWYNHLKGKMEEDAKSQGFRSLTIFRPAAIVGNTNTPGWLSWLNPKIDGILPDRFKSIGVDTLGRLMGESIIAQEQGRVTGSTIYEGTNMRELIEKKI